MHLMSRLGKFKSHSNPNQHFAQVEKVVVRSSLCNGSLDDLLDVYWASTLWVAKEQADKKAGGIL